MSRLGGFIPRPGGPTCDGMAWQKRATNGRMRSETVQARRSDLERIIPTARLIGAIPGLRIFIGSTAGGPPRLYTTVPRLSLLATRTHERQPLLHTTNAQARFQAPSADGRPHRRQHAPFQPPTSPPGSQAQPSKLPRSTCSRRSARRNPQIAPRARAAAAAVASRRPRCATAQQPAMENVWAELWDTRRDAGAPSDDGDWPELPTPPPPPLRATQDRCEVPLAALMRPVKLRGAKAKESTEFEFLPPVKNVIALDDADSNVPDEPWEYISSAGGDDEARKIFSYAEIVSKSA
ncbi:hypothetical protein EDB89DRAFT_1912151 [Lactarius sanguifluus]|nr:hypothetical protein EDB89DRAFT_1912151 [Lactarius sanguifluus]